MKKGLVFLIAAVFVLALAGNVFAQNKASAAQAKMWVDKAESFLKEKGKKVAVAEFNNPKGQFVKGDLYIYVWNLNGIIIAHPFAPETIGKDRLNMPDADGKLFRKEAVNLAKTKGSGWVDYKYKNPKSNQIEQKTTYVKKVDDVILACGAYK